MKLVAPYIRAILFEACLFEGLAHFIVTFSNFDSFIVRIDSEVGI